MIHSDKLRFMRGTYTDWWECSVCDTDPAADTVWMTYPENGETLSSLISRYAAHWNKEHRE